MYTATPEAGARTEAETPSWEYRQYRYILMGPLHRVNFEPHVILVYGTSAQVMRLVTAALWQSGGRITSSFSGRIDCADAVIAAMKSGEPQVILPCYGDRIFGQTEEHEMAFSIPYAFIDEIVAGLEGTYQGGIRYPIPNFLRYTAAFPPHYDKLNTLWAAGEDPGSGSE